MIWISVDLFKVSEQIKILTSALFNTLNHSLSLIGLKGFWSIYLNWHSCCISCVCYSSVFGGVCYYYFLCKVRSIHKSVFLSPWIRYFKRIFWRKKFFVDPLEYVLILMPHRDAAKAIQERRWSGIFWNNIDPNFLCTSVNSSHK